MCLPRGPGHVTACAIIVIAARADLRQGGAVQQGGGRFQLGTYTCEKKSLNAP